MSSRPRLIAACLACLSLSTALFFPRSAHAEKVIVKGDNWEVYTDGRVGAFLNWVVGDGNAIPTTLPDGSKDSIDGGGFAINTKDGTETYQGTASTVRIRSGFIGNTLGLGARSEIYPGLKASAYIQMWATIEPEGRNKAYTMPADVRQGYGKLEGFWGSFLAGRTRTLFSRGATDINVLYAHRWGVGLPAPVDSKGPTGGMVGFGVLGSGFAPGFIYGSPVLAGFQLNVGLFDPAALGAGGWTRTQLPRAEAELTFERAFGLGKVVLFANGAYQKVYKPGACVVSPTNLCDETAEGVGYGGRLEVGPVHLGVAGHYGKGLGFGYALEQSYAAIDIRGGGALRTFDGYYVQSQVVVKKFDFFAGAGITRVFLTQTDLAQPTVSFLKNQIGVNAGVVYNLAENVHFDLEYMRAESNWFLGEKQVLHSFASGMTVNW